MMLAEKMKFAWIGLIAATLAAFAPSSPAQMNMPGHAMESREETAPDKLPAPQKIPGVGNVHLAVTATPEAQMWFDQGLNELHDFWEYEAQRSFEQAVRVDSQCAMCYWGLAQSESFRHSMSQGYAAQSLASAVRLEHHASKRERLYINATVAQQAAADDHAAKKSSEQSQRVRILRELVRKYPHEIEGRLLLADALEDGYDDKGEPNPGQKETIAIFQGILKDDPENSAANHLYIHAVESGAHPELALHSADILARLAPASGHMVHMPGHTYFELGQYARAEQSFAASTLADETYMREQHVQPDDDWNYVHNLMYAIANLMEEGKLAAATALSSKLIGARGELEESLYISRSRDSISRVDPELPVALRTADWPQVIAKAKAVSAPATQPNLRFLAGALVDFASGMSAIDARDFSSAESFSARLDSALWRVSHQSDDTSADTKMASDMGSTTGKKTDSTAPVKLTVMPDANLKPLLTSLSIMSLELRASLLTARNQPDEAHKLFAQAAKQEKDLGYGEPPPYIRPVEETEAAALLAAGDFAGARSAYQQALHERPRSGFPLYGIATCSEKAGNATAAAREYSDFLAAWKDADPQLAQIEHAREFLAQHPVVAENGAQK
jgi:tetratricopeptide (TPR) repeat protein